MVVLQQLYLDKTPKQLTLNASSSGTLAVGSSAASTFNLPQHLEILLLDGSNSRLSGVQTMSINVATGTGWFSGGHLGYFTICGPCPRRMREQVLLSLLNDVSTAVVTQRP